MENNVKEQTTVNNIVKSKIIRKIKEPDFSKEVIIYKLQANKDMVDWHFQQIKSNMGNKITDEQIWKQINSLVLRDNVFNEAMKIIVPCYDIEIDSGEHQNLINFLKKNNKKLENVDQNIISTLAQRMIEKLLIFDSLVKEWNITVSDDDAKQFLNRYYKATNKPIRDIINNENSMKKIKKSILDQKITDTICSKLKWKADWDSIKKNAAPSQNSSQVNTQKK